MISSLLSWLATPLAARREAKAAYARVVEQARDAQFYTEFAVEDTVDGRFDMIALHVFLYSRNVQDARKKRLIIEAMIADMDRSLREMGVGDMSVGKKVEKIAHALNGRLRRYAESWEDESAFTQTLWRNLYRSDEACREAAMRLSAHLRQSYADGRELEASPPKACA